MLKTIFFDLIPCWISAGRNGRTCPALFGRSRSDPPRRDILSGHTLRSLAELPALLYAL